MAAPDLKERIKAPLRRLLNAWRARRRSAELKAEQPHTSKAEIVAGLRAMGIVPGDTVMLHSSLKSLGYVEGGPTAVLEAIHEAISPGGTLVVPTYYLPGGTIYATCQMQGYVFDPREHGSNLGALPAAFLKMPGIRRSIHPTHSVSALGPLAEDIVGQHHLAASVCGRLSPWERCVHHKAKILGLGISMGPVTFYHLLEDLMDERFPLPVRMSETFKMPCKDWQGRDITVPVRPLDPAFQGQRIDHKSRADLRQHFYDRYLKAGILHPGQVGPARSWWIRADEFYRHLEQDAQSGLTIYTTAEELSRLPA